jgi:uncharacterized metal-binding protein
MSNYKTHSSFNLLLILPLFLGVIVAFLAPQWPLLATFAISFSYSTLFMSPDMDLASQIKLFSLRGVLSIPFRSYALFFRHRGMSHSILLGTMTRLLWLFGFVNIILYLVLQIVPNTKSVFDYVMLYQEYFLWGIAGVFIADLSHLLLDKRL